MELGESSKPMRCQRHLGGRFKFSLNGSTGATFFLGVSEPRLNINTSALLFFVPNKSENRARISGGSLLYRAGRVGKLKRSILRDAVQANRFIGGISLLPKRLALLVHRNGTTKV